MGKKHKWESSKYLLLSFHKIHIIWYKYLCFTMKIQTVLPIGATVTISARTRFFSDMLETLPCRIVIDIYLHATCIVLLFEYFPLAVNFPQFIDIRLSVITSHDLCVRPVIREIRCARAATNAILILQNFLIECFERRIESHNLNLFELRCNVRVLFFKCRKQRSVCVFFLIR